MSEDAIIKNDMKTKEPRFGALKTAILVVLGLLIIGGVSTTILYLTNSNVKTSIDGLGNRLGIMESDSGNPDNADTW